MSAIVADLKAKEDWTRHLRASKSESWDELPYIEQCGLPILPNAAASRDLRGASFRDVDLSDSEGLADAALDWATFLNVRLNNSSLNGSSLRYVKFHGSTSLDGVIAHFASFADAVCRGISLRGLDLRDTDLAGCDLRDADLRDARLVKIRITREGGFGLLSGSWTRFGGKYQTAFYLHKNTPHVVAQFIEESSRILHLLRSGSLRAWLRYLHDNFGRSAVRWGSSVLGGLWLLFAFLYASFPVPRFLQQTELGEILQQAHLEFKVGECVKALTLMDALYLSAVTITTLGYGDIVPAPGHMGRILVMLESFAGVIVFGIFINKLMKDTKWDWE